MKDFNMLVWLTQLGMSTALPLLGFIWGAMWLKERFELGNWVLVCGIVVGLICAVDGMIHSFVIMNRMIRKPEEEKEKQLKTPIVTFNEHD